ncbi:MAG TPA: nucleotidyltransferase family protein [Myxococcota bacterium]|nr:nucleotidyltransferase family protein [Myxococcota bacterium]HRY93150.1 nucleotidyltransferase family protein [Myxococcota bacterium]HSA23150.1 nucleotidyltransferase family protein [Myxococcota bacterium]
MNSLHSLCSLLSSSSPPPHISPDLIEFAERAGVLDVLAGRPGMRRLVGDAAEAYMTQAALGALRLQELRRLAGALSGAGVPVMPLKGMAYALLFEPGGPSRAMADTDLLVPEPAYRTACDVLLGHGYAEVETALSRAPGYHERAFRGPHGLLVEIHRRFLPGGRLAIDYPGLWARSRPAGAECGDCRLLSPEDGFLHHALHMGVHEYVMGLRPVWELWRLLRQDPPDLEVAAGRARAWGSRGMTWCALRLLEECFPGTVSPPDLARFRPVAPRALALERLVVRPSIDLLSNPGPLTRGTQLLRKGLLLERPIGGIAYLAWWIRNR